MNIIKKLSLGMIAFQALVNSSYGMQTAIHASRYQHSLLHARKLTTCVPFCKHEIQDFNLMTYPQNEHPSPFMRVVKGEDRSFIVHYPQFGRYYTSFLNDPQHGLTIGEYRPERKVEFLFRMINLYDGNVVSSVQLPGIPSGFLPTKKHITIIGSYEKENQNYLNLNESWMIVLDKLTGQFNYWLHFPHSISEITPLGVLKGDEVAVFQECREDKSRFILYFDPEKIKLCSEHFFNGKGWLDVFDGRVVVSRYGMGYIKIHEEDNIITDVNIACYPPEAKAIDNKIFYKDSEKHLVGYDLKKHTQIFRKPLSKAFLSYDITEEIDGFNWLFEIGLRTIMASIVTENSLKFCWAYVSLTDSINGIKLKLDKKNKKLWGVNDGYRKVKLLCWDIETGTLEYESTLELSGTSRIISFSPLGEPIIQLR